jgi:hypothetical protein
MPRRPKSPLRVPEQQMTSLPQQYKTDCGPLKTGHAVGHRGLFQRRIVAFYVADLDPSPLSCSKGRSHKCHPKFGLEPMRSMGPIPSAKFAPICVFRNVVFARRTRGPAIWRVTPGGNELATGEQGNCHAPLREGQGDGVCGLASSPPQHVPLGAAPLSCPQAMHFHSKNDGGLLIPQ